MEDGATRTSRDSPIVRGQNAYLAPRARGVSVICPRIGRKDRGRIRHAGHSAMFALYTGVNFANPSGEADERDLRLARYGRNSTSDRTPSDISPAVLPAAVTPSSNDPTPTSRPCNAASRRYAIVQRPTPTSRPCNAASRRYAIVQRPNANVLALQCCQPPLRHRPTTNANVPSLQCCQPAVTPSSNDQRQRPVPAMLPARRYAIVPAANHQRPLIR
jgi:hypothetical protein